jgi:hypothetical protein
MGRDIIMTFKEFKERVEMGEEFQFYYLNESYWISQNHEGFYLTREKDGYSQSFSSAEELFENAKINDRKIIEIWSEIDI